MNITYMSPYRCFWKNGISRYRSIAVSRIHIAISGNNVPAQGKDRPTSGCWGCGYTDCVWMNDLIFYYIPK